MSAIVFLDTETTGLSLDDDIWEFAAIRRETDGTQAVWHYFVEHDTDKCLRLPHAFRDDHRRRYRTGCPQEFIARHFYELTKDRPHIVGLVPNFDTERLAILLRRFGYEPRWHYHLIDVEALAVGYLHARANNDPTGGWERPPLPWRSDDLSRACGVEPPDEGERHTALGDARWAMRWYDAITGSGL